MLNNLLLIIALSGIVSVSNQRAEYSIKWLFNIEEAKIEADEKGKPILISFAGSDWCKPCIKLTREVFETEKFSDYAAEKFVLVMADFPRYKKNRLSADQTIHNELLASQYNQGGEFPLVVIIDSNGKVLAKTGYQEGGPENFITHLDTLLVRME